MVARLSALKCFRGERLLSFFRVPLVYGASFWNIERSVIRLFGFIMESHALIGPALPPMFKKKDTDEDSEDETACKSEINIRCYRCNVIVINLYVTLFLYIFFI